MTSVNTLIDSPLISNLGWTLLHFVWQGALVGMAYAVARFMLRTTKPATLYMLALSALGLLTVLPIITFMHLNAIAPSAVASSSSAAYAAAVSNSTLIQHFHMLIQPLVPWSVPIWCAGVALMALRTFSGWKQASVLAAPASITHLPLWQPKVGQLATRLGITRIVRIATSAKILVPCTIGCLKPVILIPPSTIAGLSPYQLEMIIAHELAHISRHDYLVNLLQLLVETILFYHPVVRWISRDIRHQRELCCDDLAVRTCGDALDYARALTELAGLQHQRPVTAIGLDGGELVMRVDRLLYPRGDILHSTSGNGWFTAFVVAILMLGLSFSLGQPHHIQIHAPSIALPGILSETSQVHQAYRQHATPVTQQPHFQYTAIKPSVAPAHISQFHIQESPTLITSTAEIALPAPIAARLEPLPAQPSQSKPAVKAAPVQTGSTTTEYSQIQQSAQGPIKIIRLHSFQSTPGTEQHPNDRWQHSYCQPITGSRICS